MSRMITLPEQIHHNTMTTDLTVRNNGSGERYFFFSQGEQQKLLLNRSQVFELYQFFRLPGVAQMIEEAFLAEQQEIFAAFQADQRRFEERLVRAG
jgi:hypothetical protein